MEFGKLSDISKVDFSLPSIDLRTLSVLKPIGGTAKVAGLAKTSAISVLIGCPVWGAKAWLGTVYPRTASASEFLSIYTQQFNTIELNSTHYQVPTLETILKWRDLSSDGFEYCPKVPQEISHHLQLRNISSLITEFAERISHLDEHLGTCFLQLPPNFSPKDFWLLKELGRSWPKELALSLEFRHHGWFSSNETESKLNDLAFDFLSSEGFGSVVTDVAGRRDVCHLSLPTNEAMLRFVANSDVEKTEILLASDLHRIDLWIEKFSTLSARGLNKIYFFAHAPNDTFAPEIAKVFTEKLNAKIGLKLPTWQPQARGEQIGFQL